MTDLPGNTGPHGTRNEPLARDLSNTLPGGRNVPKLVADTREPAQPLNTPLTLEGRAEGLGIPKDRFGGKSGALSAGVHIGLLIMLFFSVQWVTKDPEPVQAELWTSAPEVQPEPEVKPPVPEPVTPTPELPKADIALEKDKKKPKEEPKKPEPKKEEPKKPEPKKPEPKPEPKKEEPKKPDPKPSAADKALEKIRQDEVRRALAAAGGATGNPNQGAANGSLTGAGSGSGRGDPGYGDRIRAKVLGNIVFNIPGDISGNPEAKFIVEQLPSGEILSVKKIKSSGLPGWDDAVERAIRKSDPLPRPKEGGYERVLELTFRPKDSR